MAPMQFVMRSRFQIAPIKSVDFFEKKKIIFICVIRISKWNIKMGFDNTLQGK